MEILPELSGYQILPIQSIFECMNLYIICGLFYIQHIYDKVDNIFTDENVAVLLSFIASIVFTCTQLKYEM